MAQRRQRRGSWRRNRKVPIPTTWSKKEEKKSEGGANVVKSDISLEE
jgi:hypothetical protein